MNREGSQGVSFFPHMISLYSNEKESALRGASQMLDLMQLVLMLMVPSIPMVLMVLPHYSAHGVHGAHAHGHTTGYS
eukprot:1159791-Pelagomonas_calceolata.AAC.2